MTVMNQQTVYVLFGSCQVVVQSNVFEVLAWVERCFRNMIVMEITPVIKTVEVHKNGGTYHLIVNNKARAEDSFLNNILGLLNYEITWLLIKSHPDFLWLHAGAAAYQGCVVLLSGAGGQGKSTLTTNLCTQHGWVYLSDDVLPLNLNSHKVLPFLRTPAVRENTGQELLPQHRLSELKKFDVALKPESLCREAMPIGAVVFPAYNLHVQTEILPCSPATAVLKLLNNSLNFAEHKEKSIRYLCDLLEHVPAFDLPFSDSKLATEIIVKAHQNW